MTPLFQVLSVFLDPIIWGAALLMAAVVGLVELVRIAGTHKRLKLEVAWVAAHGIAASVHGLTHKGGITRYFLNLDYLTTTPDDVRKLSEWYVQAINRLASKTEAGALAFVEKDSGPVGAITLMGHIVTMTGMPAVTVRLRKRKPVTKLAGKPDIVKELSTGKKALVVTDAITSGRTVADTIEAIREFGGQVVGICALLDRRDESAEYFGNIPVVCGTSEKELAEEGFVRP